MLCLHPWLVLPWCMWFLYPLLWSLLKCPGYTLIAACPWALASIGVVVLACVGTVHIVICLAVNLGNIGGDEVGGVMWGGGTLCQLEYRTASKEYESLKMIVNIKNTFLNKNMHPYLAPVDTVHDQCPPLSCGKHPIEHR